MKTITDLPCLPNMTWDQVMSKLKTYKDIGVTGQFRLNYGYFRTILLAGAFDNMLEQHVGRPLVWKDYELILADLAKVMKYKPSQPKVRKSARVSMSEQAAAIQGDMGLSMWRLNNCPVTTAHADMSIVKKTLESRGAKPLPPGSGYLFTFEDCYVLKDISTLKESRAYDFFKYAGKHMKGVNGWQQRPYPAILCLVMGAEIKKTKKGDEMMLISVLHGDLLIEGIVAWSMRESGTMSQKVVQRVRSGAYGLMKLSLNNYNGKPGYIFESFEEITA